MTDFQTRQIIYHSTATLPVDTDRILEQSRHNNAIDGVTGVLWFNGTFFIQVLEGSSLSVVETFKRIAKDSRHEDIVIVCDHLIEKKEFGSWSMERHAYSAANRGPLAKLKTKLADLPSEEQQRLLEKL